MKIANDVMEVLVKSTVDSNKLFLPPTQLDRKLYTDVNKVLENIGGKWNRSAKCHIFEVDPSDVLDDIINSGEYTDKKKEFQFFETPVELAKHMVELAEIGTHMRLLEPSFGKGRILNQFPEPNDIYGVELNKENAEYTFKNALVHYQHLIEGDFLNPIQYMPYIPAKSDRIVMNPPFHGGADVKHIFQAWDLLAENGILVSIVSESPFFRENKLSQEFRQWIDDNNVYVESLDAGTFKESGTMVKTRLIVAKK